MSADSLEFLVLVILVVVAAGLFLFSSYWAFSIRKVLVTFAYRRQALWVAVVGLFFAAFFVFSALSLSLNLSNGPVDTYVGVLFIVLGFVVIFAWIDATMHIARKADPLHRNTLHWRGLRYFIVVATSFGILFNVVLSSRFNPAPGNASVLGFTIFGPIGTALLLGGIALLVSSRRSKDAILVRHLKWMGAFIVFLYLTTTAEHEISSRLYILNNSIVLLEIITYSLFAISAFFLYVSARSLTPISPYPTEEPYSSLEATTPESA